MSETKIETCPYPLSKEAKEQVDEIPYSKVSKEELFHFLCRSCQGWWSIGDADQKREFWFCPYCGAMVRFNFKGL